MSAATESLWRWMNEANNEDAIWLLFIIAVKHFHTAVVDYLPTTSFLSPVTASINSSMLGPQPDFLFVGLAV